MMRTFIDSTAPVVASAGLYGLTESELGKTLIILMALAVILNQLWQVGEKISRAVRGTPGASDGAGSPLCDQRHRELASQMAHLRDEDARQDRLTSDRFGNISASLSALRQEFRDDVKGLHERSDDVLKAVSRLEGRVG